MRHARKEKWQSTHDGRSRNQVVIGEKETYLGILEVDNIKQVEMMDKIKKEYLRITRRLLDTKLYSKNLVKGTNTWVLHLVRYSGPFLK